MKFARILFLLTAASLGGAHAATLCCDPEVTDGALGIIQQGAGNATLSVSSSFAGSGSIVHATDWLALSSAGILTPSGARLVSGPVMLTSGSVFEWNLNATTKPSSSYQDPTNRVLFIGYREGANAVTGQPNNPFDFRAGASIGGMTSSWESVFNLTAPTTVVSATIPEPSSVAISTLLIAAGLLRRRRVA